MNENVIVRISKADKALAFLEDGERNYRADQAMLPNW
jgi:hypothetical protein